MTILDVKHAWWYRLAKVLMAAAAAMLLIWYILTLRVDQRETRRPDPVRSVIHCLRSGEEFAASAVGMSASDLDLSSSREVYDFELSRKPELAQLERAGVPQENIQRYVSNVVNDEVVVFRSTEMGHARGFAIARACGDSTALDDYIRNPPVLPAYITLQYEAVLVASRQKAVMIALAEFVVWLVFMCVLVFGLRSVLFYVLTGRLK